MSTVPLLFSSSLQSTTNSSLRSKTHMRLSRYNAETLYLSENKLTGSVPFEFSHLSSLELLSIYNNSLTGSIPVELEAIANLTCFARKLHNRSPNGAAIL